MSRRSRWIAAGAGVAVLLLGSLWAGFLRERSRAPEVRVHHEPSARGEPGRELVVFVLVDALRRDHLGAYGHPRPTSPTLDDLTRRGLWLRHLTTHASHTVPSTLSLWSSRLPSEHGLQYDPETRSFDATGAAAIPRVPESLPLLAELFSDAGYYTAGFVANPWLRRAHGFARGFDHYAELESRDGARLNAMARELLEAHAGEKVFLYLHYMDVHNPYHGPSRGPAGFERPAAGRYRYRNGPAPELSAEDLAYTRALYDERIVYLDGHLREWLDAFERARPPREVTWVITSDHGDEFLEHGGLGHGTSLFNEQINAFALLVGPTFAPRVVEGCSASIDVLPTLLEGLGLPVPDGLQGRSFARPGPQDEGCPRPIVSELADRKAVLLEGWKLLQGPGERRSFHRVGRAGRIETRPQGLDDDALRDRLERVLAALPETAAAPSDGMVPLDAETRRRLEALGYLEP